MHPLQQFEVLVPVFRDGAGAVTSESLDRQTPCEKWVVRDLFGHMLGGSTMFAAVVRGTEPSAVPAPVDDDLVEVTLAAIEDLVAAFGEDGVLTRIVATPFGEMDGETFARLVAVDLAMHAWDLHRALGRPISVPDEVVGAIDGFARAAIAPEIRGPETFGPELDAPDGAPAIDRLAAFTGRSA